jgi:hypothetical protein
MEGFDFTDKNSQRLIKKTIGECDYFVLLIAHKYGVLEDGTSRIEAEYTHALDMGIPALAVIIGEKARWKASKKETNPRVIKTLEGFKQRLQSHPHVFWNKFDELERNTRELLLEELFLNPRKGWVSADQVIQPRVVNEMARLLGENWELRKQIPIEGKGGIQWQEKAKHTLEMLAVSKVSLSFYYGTGENWENTIKCRYLRLFKLLVPELYIAKTTAELSRFLGSILNPDLSRVVRKDYPTPSNTIKKIMADFNLLGLVRFTGTGDDEVWELTEYGKELYAAYRMRQFERGLNAAGAKVVEEKAPED